MLTASQQLLFDNSLRVGFEETIGVRSREGKLTSQKGRDVTQGSFTAYKVTSRSRCSRRRSRLKSRRKGNAQRRLRQPKGMSMLQGDVTSQDAYEEGHGRVPESAQQSHQVAEEGEGDRQESGADCIGKGLVVRTGSTATAEEKCTESISVMSRT